MFVSIVSDLISGGSQPCWGSVSLDPGKAVLEAGILG